MQASLKLTAAWGGKQIDLPEILTHLKKNNVCMGLSKLKIQTLLKQLGTLKGEVCQSDIAQGKAPVNGLNAVLERKSVPRAWTLTPATRAGRWQCRYA